MTRSTSRRLARFRSKREEAESRMKTVKTCEEGTVGGASSTTIIKDKDQGRVP